MPVDQLAAKGSLEKIVSIDSVVIPAVRQNLNNRPGKYTIKVIVDPTNAVLESKETNNTTLSDIVIAKAPVPEKAYDYTKVYTASNQSELIQMALDGPLKPLVDAGLDMNKVIVKILPIAEANAEYEKTFSKKISWGLRSVPFVRPVVVNGVWTGQAEVIISEGILPQAMPTLVREISAAYYALKNTSGYGVGVKVGANELLAYIAQWYACSWFAENGIILGGNISYETNKLTLDYVLQNTTDMMAKRLRSLWALSARLGYPDGGVPSSVLLQLMMDIVNMPDPTDFANKLYAEADKLDGNMLVSKAYWNAMVEPKNTQPRILPAGVGSVISSPPIPANVVLTLGDVIAAQENPLYPVYPIK